MHIEMATPAGGAGKASMGEEGGSNSDANNEASAIVKYNRKLERYRAELAEKPVFLIATHGRYTEADISIPAVVKKSDVLIELTTIGEEATCKLGHIGTPLHTLLNNSKKLANVITAPMGSGFADRDIDTLFRGAKYTGGNHYYERSHIITAENTDVGYYIHCFYNKSMFNMTGLRRLLVENGPISTSNLIDTIYELITNKNPESPFIEIGSAAEKHGCIFILATCGAIEEEDGILPEQITRITSLYDLHRGPLIAHPYIKFKFRRTVRNTNGMRGFSELYNMRNTHRNADRHRKAIKPLVSFVQLPKHKDKKLVHNQEAPLYLQRLYGNIKSTSLKPRRVHNLIINNVGKKEPITYVTKPPPDLFMIKIGNSIYHKRFKKEIKTMFTAAEVGRIIRYFTLNFPPSELPTIEVYDPKKRRWEVVYEEI